jgi:hypothetical protein
MFSSIRNLKVVAAMQIVLGLMTFAIMAGVFASPAYATGVCDNYRPTTVHGYCPVNGTMSEGEWLYSTFGKSALGNEIGMAASRSWWLKYYYDGGFNVYSSASGTGAYGALGSSSGTRINPSCGFLGSSVNGNCDVQYIV